MPVGNGLFCLEPQREQLYLFWLITTVNKAFEANDKQKVRDPGGFQKPWWKWAGWKRTASATAKNVLKEHFSLFIVSALHNKQAHVRRFKTNNKTAYQANFFQLAGEGGAALSPLSLNPGTAPGSQIHGRMPDIKQPDYPTWWTLHNSKLSTRFCTINNNIDKCSILADIFYSSGCFYTWTRQRR